MFDFSGCGLCDNVTLVILRILGGVFNCCMFCCPACRVGPEVFDDIHGQVLQGEGHAHQEEVGEVDQEEHDDQFCLLEEGRGRETNHQDR